MNKQKLSAYLQRFSIFIVLIVMTVSGAVSNLDGYIIKEYI